jgi:hypothetical protein
MNNTIQLEALIENATFPLVVERVRENRDLISQKPEGLEVRTVETPEDAMRRR